MSFLNALAYARALHLDTVTWEPSDRSDDRGLGWITWTPADTRIPERAHLNLRRAMKLAVLSMDRSRVGDSRLDRPWRLVVADASVLAPVPDSELRRAV